MPLLKSIVNISEKIFQLQHLYSPIAYNFLFILVYRISPLRTSASLAGACPDIAKFIYKLVETWYHQAILM